MKKDMSKKCGVDLSICDGGVLCYQDNGETKRCKKCFCRVCMHGKCAPSQRTPLG